MIRLLLLVLILGGYCTGQAQTIRGYIYDDTDKSPLTNAFVFISNSERGTSTDFNGFFELAVGKHDKVNLTISHLGHEIKNVIVDLSETTELTIMLTQKALELESFQVSSKYDEGLYKRRLKRFTNALIGSNIKRGDVVIKNEKALLFSSKQGKLIAQATEPLLIENNKLGYDLRFYLKKFELNSNGDLFYQGSAFFTEQEGKKKHKARHKKNRKKTFANTSRDFFTKLINNEIDPEEYMMAYSYENAQGEFVVLKQITSDSIDIRSIEQDKYEIPIRGYLTVFLKKKKDTSQMTTSTGLQGAMRTNRQAAMGFAKSFIKSRINTIYVNSQGAILNPLDLEEYGYWTDQRLGTLLPFDYSSD